MCIHGPTFNNFEYSEKYSNNLKIGKKFKFESVNNLMDNGNHFKIYHHAWELPWLSLPLMLLLVYAREVIVSSLVEDELLALRRQQKPLKFISITFPLVLSLFPSREYLSFLLVKLYHELSCWCQHESHSTGWIYQ